MSKLKVCPVCPMCKSPHDREVDPGSKVTCPDCDEVYHAEAPEPSEKVARPMERSPGKRAAPAADTDDDSKPKARAKPAAKKPATARRSRSEREPANGGGQVLVLLAAGIGGLVLLAAVGGGFLMWALSGKKDDKREVAQQVAPAPDVPVPVPQPQPPQPQPVVQKDDPDLGPRPGVKRPAPQTAAPVPSPSPRSKRRTEPPVPVGPPPEPPGPDVPSFAEPANPFKPGTQTKLRQVRAVKLPAPPAPKDMTGRFAAPEPAQLAHSPKHDLLFVRRSDMVWAYDLKADNELGGRRAKEQFTDLSLSPDEAAAFAADYGQEHTGYGTPVNPHWIHRFDMATREWESRKAPKVAWRMEAVDAHRVLLGERDQWIAVSLNRWETDGVGIRELARIGADRSSDFEYNPRTGQVYYANGTLLQVRGDKLVQAPRPASPAGQRAAWGATAVLSRDGTKLYSGAVQVDAADPTNVLEKFPEPILAASRDIAFGAKAYYRATSGSTLGEYPFPAEKKADRSDPYGTVTRTAVHVSPDGLSVWVLDPAKNAAVQFAIEGEK